ncbi:YcnI family protein [Streptomyces sp. NPDC003077]|uniref:YcnI family copper-binding membrane protein n=1 Tax=Streptomyces sp. NPDC003077 TaxID=3154443 RepID=UPI0033B7E6D6
MSKTTVSPSTTDAQSTTAPSRHRLVRRLPVLGGIAAGSVLLLATPALAHVSVQPGQAEQGGYATINFKVPNERDNASTVKLEVTLPTDHPLASAMPQPVPGWKVEVTKAKLAKPIEMHGEKVTEAPSKITWTADGGKIEPGQFQQFPVSVGQLPKDADQIVFKALQTYDNKEVVRWIEPAQEGQKEPDNPAPVLKLVAATTDGHGADAAKNGEKTEAAAADGSDTTARVLGVVGIVVGVLGVAFGVLAGRRRRA